MTKTQITNDTIRNHLKHTAFGNNWIRDTKDSLCFLEVFGIASNDKKYYLNIKKEISISGLERFGITKDDLEKLINKKIDAGISEIKTYLHFLLSNRVGLKNYKGRFKLQEIEFKTE